MDTAARALRLDPAEIRRRNFIPADAFPFRTVTGQVYDSGDYPGALARALAAADYPALRRAQEERRRRGIRTSAWRVWAPIAAGLGLLGFLGTSPNADLLAHIFGFGVGALLGLIAAPLEAYRARMTLQFVLSAMALLVVLGCWLIART